MSRVVSFVGRRVDLRALDPLATGGEASVYAVDGRALKLWHAPSPSRVRKLRALLGRHGGLPGAVVAPDAEVVDELFLATLSRLPDAREKQGALERVKAAGDRTKGFTDVLWALINTREFVLNH